MSESDFIPFHVVDIGDAEIDAVVATLRSGWLTTGPRVGEFEKEFAKFVGAAHAVAVNSATAALHLGLDAIGLKPEEEVIVPTMTFAASAEVVAYFRARPVLIDCDAETLNVTADIIERAITPRTRAVMPVHVGGLPCDMEPILAVASAHGIRVLEDAAHALPARDRGQRIGSIGDLTAFSFYATKTLTTGEGGMLTTDNAEFASRAKLMRLHGISRHAWNRYSAEGSWRYEILEAGYKYNLTDIAAAIGLAQLRRVETMRAARGRIAAAYDHGFSALPEVQLPSRRADTDHAWHLYAMRLRGDRLRLSRDGFIQELKTRGIGTSVHFIPLHMHPYYRSQFGFHDADFPNASAASAKLVSLPLFPTMSDAQVNRVIETVTDVIEENRC